MRSSDVVLLYNQAPFEFRIKNFKPKQFNSILKFWQSWIKSKQPASVLNGVLFCVFQYKLKVSVEYVKKRHQNSM
jgi:hypothetical protein